METAASVKATGQSATVALMDAAIVGEAATEQDAAMVRATARMEAANQAATREATADAAVLGKVVA